MTDASTRIWAWPHFDGWITGDWSANTYHDERTVAYILAAEHERIVAERDRLIGALRAVEADCLDRAKFSRDGKTVPIGDGAWRELCAALASIKEADNG